MVDCERCKRSKYGACYKHFSRLGEVGKPVDAESIVVGYVFGEVEPPREMARLVESYRNMSADVEARGNSEQIDRAMNLLFDEMQERVGS